MPEAPSRPRTALIWHERFSWYRPGLGASFMAPGGLVQPFEPVDTPDSKTRFRSLVDVSGLSEHLTALTAPAAGEEEILKFHTWDYLDRLKQLDSVGAGDAGLAAPVGPDAYVTACHALGGALLAVDEVLSGRHQNAYALVRPPGHHARPSEGLGSCILANEVLAIRHAMDSYGVDRVAVVDWDVHHGNSMQEAFWDDPVVLTVSIHQDGFFPPASGAAGERGGPKAGGSNVNIPLPPGAGHGAYMEAAERIIEPALRAHRPDVVFACSGYDAAAIDPMGRMLLHSESFRKLAQIALTVAEEECEGRLVAIQEGGVSAAYTPFCGLAVVEEMAGARVAEDPFLEMIKDVPGGQITPEQRNAIDLAAEGLSLA